MSELLRKIYEQAIQDEDIAVAMVRRVDDWAKSLTVPYRDVLDDDQMELLQNLLFSTAIRAEEEGFQLGIRVIVKLVLEILADS